MGVFYSAGARKLPADAGREKQEGIQGQWQHESPFREVLQEVKRGADADCRPQMMRRCYYAMKNDSWEDFEERYRKEGKSSERTFEFIREACGKVAKDEIGRLGMVPEKHGLLEADHRTSRRNGRRHFVVCLLPALQQGSP